MEEWESLLITAESDETYLKVNLAQWWSECVEQTEEGLPQDQYSMTSSLRQKMIQQPETVLDDVVNQIKEIEVGHIYFTESPSVR